MRTTTHFLSCTHELREGRGLVQLVSTTGKHKPVENRVIVFVDSPPKPFAMTRHFDHLVWPTGDKLRDTIQIGETRGRLIHCTVNHLVDSRFGQACARTPGILQNEGGCERHQVVHKARSAPPALLLDRHRRPTTSIHAPNPLVSRTLDPCTFSIWFIYVQRAHFPTPGELKRLHCLLPSRTTQ